ncbi:MAG: putative quinol monooxygenase [bacterium]
MISLVSTWPLKNGCPPELQRMLQGLAQQVEECEPGTLTYLVNLEANSPIKSVHSKIEIKVPPPPPIPLAEQKAVIFIEMYQDVEAFAKHVSGPVFTKFQKDAEEYFIPNAAMSSSTRTNTPMLVQQSGFIRPEVLKLIDGSSQQD